MVDSKGEKQPDPKAIVQGDDVIDLDGQEGDLSSQKRHHLGKEPEVRLYYPGWSIQADDVFASEASDLAKNLGPDLCRSFNLPTDRPIYASNQSIPA